MVCAGDLAAASGRLLWDRTQISLLQSVRRARSEITHFVAGRLQGDAAGRGGARLAALHDRTLAANETEWVRSNGHRARSDGQIGHILKGFPRTAGQ